MHVHLKGLVVDLDVDFPIPLRDFRLKLWPGKWIFELGQRILNFGERIFNFDRGLGRLLVLRRIRGFQTKLHHRCMVQFIQLEPGEAATVLDENMRGRLGRNGHVGINVCAHLKKGHYVRRRTGADTQKSQGQSGINTLPNRRSNCESHIYLIGRKPKRLNLSNQEVCRGVK